MGEGSEATRGWVEPDAITYNLAITACEKRSNWKNALEFSQEMGSRGVQPNVNTYNSAISACE